MQPRRTRLDADALWQYAVKALAGRAHSAGELRQKLRDRAQKASDVDATLARLKQSNYLDDRRFAENFAAARLDDQRGRARVVRELRQRRVAPGVAERTVAKVYHDVDETALIESFVRRKYRTASREGLFQDEKELASAYRRLLRAGFSTGAIIRVLKRFAANPDLLDQFEPPEESIEEPS